MSRKKHFIVIIAITTSLFHLIIFINFFNDDDAFKQNYDNIDLSILNEDKPFFQENSNFYKNPNNPNNYNNPNNPNNPNNYNNPSDYNNPNNSNNQNLQQNHNFQHSFSFHESTTFSVFIERLATDWHFWWLSVRMQQTWRFIKPSAESFLGHCSDYKGTKKKILLLPGFLSLTNLATKSSIKNGGPLGELTQWADLISGCLALCHNVAVRANLKNVAFDLRSLNNKMPQKSGCGADDDIDLIFTDIQGYRALSADVIRAFKHKFRIVDVFGTEAVYNDALYLKERGEKVNGWAGLHVNLKQFFTLFPHTPENTQLGFIIHSKPTSIKTNQKQNFSLILGKEGKYLKDKMTILQTIHNILPIKATIHPMYSRMLPTGAELLGSLEPEEYQSLLSTARMCIGAGHPIESPSPVLALASGCAFLNPIFNYSLNGKPTRRKITSQHTYLERYFKPPYVYTYDPNNPTQLTRILKDILKQQIKPVIPWIFTAKGYLIQLNHNLLHQNYCHKDNKTNNIVSEDHIKNLFSRYNTTKFNKPNKIFVTDSSIDCKDFCYQKGLICDFEEFKDLNNLTSFEKLQLPCQRIVRTRQPWSPAYDPHKKLCSLQPNINPLFSCSSSFEEDLVLGEISETIDVTSHPSIEKRNVWKGVNDDEEAFNKSEPKTKYINSDESEAKIKYKNTDWEKLFSVHFEKDVSNESNLKIGKSIGNKDFHLLTTHARNLKNLKKKQNGKRLNKNKIVNKNKILNKNKIFNEDQNGNSDKNFKDKRGDQIPNNYLNNKLKSDTYVGLRRLCVCTEDYYGLTEDNV